jgi:GT2 family glycosyltransferase
MQSYPFITVIMPIRNEARYIVRSLNAILEQDYPADRMEVLIADGMSEDGTRELVQQIIAERRRRQHGHAAAPGQVPAAIMLLDNPGRIVPTGLNSAIRRANGEIIVRVDGHAVIQPDYLKQCVTWLEQTGADCVGGVVVAAGKGYIGHAIARTVSSPFGVGGASHRTMVSRDMPMPADTVPFGVYRREIFARIGLFNEQMIRHQDYEFNYRLRRAGGTIMLLPFIRIGYHARSDLRSLWQQYWQYGCWKGYFLRTHPDSLRLRHLIPPLFVLTVALAGILALLAVTGLWLLGVTLGLYLVFLSIAAAILGKQNGLRYIALFPVILACLHLSWGIGVWRGLLLPGLARSSTQVSPHYHKNVQ